MLFLVQERIFMENIGAVKELCKVTDNLETRIDQLERINRRLSKLKRGDSLKSNSTVSSTMKQHQAKCARHHCPHKHTELCTNKFIQIIIVVLVLIMAFCLAAITTLYLMETAKFNRQFYGQVTLQTLQQRPPPTKKPNNNNKIRLYQTTSSPHHVTLPTQMLTLDVSHMLRKPSDIIGRPVECSMVEQDLENANLCQVYCCVVNGNQVDAPIEAAIFKQNKSDMNLHEDGMAKTFHTNDIDKQTVRQKRDALGLPHETAIFDSLGNILFCFYGNNKKFIEL